MLEALSRTEMSGSIPAKERQSAAVASSIVCSVMLAMGERRSAARLHVTGDGPGLSAICRPSHSNLSLPRGLWKLRWKSAVLLCHLYPSWGLKAA